MSFIFKTFRPVEIIIFYLEIIKMMKKNLLGILAIIIVTSCSNDKLTKEQAFEILNQDYDYQCYDWLGSFSNSWSGNVWEEINNTRILQNT